MFSKHLLIVAAMLGSSAVTATVALLPVPAAAQQSADVAVKGIDLVSFFLPGNSPVAGNPQFAVVHGNNRYLFASQANADAFRARPANFLPQYAGYCAWAAAQGYIAPGSPKFAAVVKGKLYFNYDADVQSTWSKDIPGFIAKADRNWPKLASDAN